MAQGKNSLSLGREMAQKLDEIAESQNCIKAAMDNIQKEQESIRKDVDAQLEHLRPSWPAWMLALLLLVASGGLFGSIAQISMTLSSANQQVTSSHVAS
jgi:hypothetical protein